MPPAYIITKNNFTYSPLSGGQDDIELIETCNRETPNNLAFSKKVTVQ